MRSEPAPSAPPRNPELEKAILAAPDDREPIAALGAWLQSQHDPWGDLIVAQLAGDKATASAIITKQERFLFGLFNSNLLTLRNGLIVAATPSSHSELPAHEDLPVFFALRPAFAVRSVNLLYAPGRKAQEAISRTAPISLTELKFWLEDDLNGGGQLSLPQLQKLELYRYGTGLQPRHVAGLFEARGVPALRELRLHGSDDYPLPAPVVKAFVGSKLLRQLEVLSLENWIVREDGARVIVDNLGKLAHLKAVNVDDAGPGTEALEVALAPQMKAFAEFEAARRPDPEDEPE